MNLNPPWVCNCCLCICEDDEDGTNPDLDDKISDGWSDQVDFPQSVARYFFSTSIVPRQMALSGFLVLISQELWEMTLALVFPFPILLLVLLTAILGNTATSAPKQLYGIRLLAGPVTTLRHFRGILQEFIINLALPEFQSLHMTTPMLRVSHGVVLLSNDLTPDLRSPSCIRSSSASSFSLQPSLSHR
jgi:hypothetical protein